MSSIAIVDDDSDFAGSLSRAIQADGIKQEILLFSDPEIFLKKCQENIFDVVILDLCIDENIGVESGFKTLTALQAISPITRVIVLTGHASTDHGIRAIKNGAANFLSKPPSIGHLSALIHDGLNQAQIRKYYFSSSESSVHELVVGNSSRVVELRKNILFASSNNMPLLIRGETGTGKSFLAKSIHQLSTRKGGNFVKYVPSFTSGDLVHSEIFGHVKGAFTGANLDRRGLLEEADKGTFFIDEVDELPKETQVLLLAVLQDKKFRKIGATKELESDFRLITATNSDIEKRIADGKFREDLFQRISHVTLNLPSLRDRTEDIASLSRYFLKNLSQRCEFHGGSITEDAINVLTNYSWPGNLRELEAVIERSIYRAMFEMTAVIDIRHLGLPGTDVSQERGAEYNDSNIELSYHEKISNYKKTIINSALSKSNGNQSEAARLLKMDRTSFRRILQELGEVRG